MLEGLVEFFELVDDFDVEVNWEPDGGGEGGLVPEVIDFKFGVAVNVGVVVVVFVAVD